MIIQTGMRTDIPAFYSKWFLNRLREGYVLVRNPYNPVSVTRYRLSPDVVDLIGFCSKNPAPMLTNEAVAALHPYGQYWFVTITPYGPDIEPNVPPKEEVIHYFRTLSGIVGADAIGWRYDPILLNEEYPLQRHLEDFAMMAEALSGFTHTCVISFIDLYQKVRRNFPQAQAVSTVDRLTIGRAFAGIGRRCGMTVKACAEGNDLAPLGIDCRGCMTMETYESALHCSLSAPSRPSSRAQCACFLNSDIGQYDTCPHLCRYCYANTDEAAVRRNLQRHDPDSPFLTGHPRPEDQLHEARQESWRDGQLRLPL
ncbi:MAG: DUF1848 domain-containing protein [Eubacteriales bacterium]|nr:DUF1848 domain-containing protein [Eubacteriales bacterium]